MEREPRKTYAMGHKDSRNGPEGEPPHAVHARWDEGRPPGGRGHESRRCRGRLAHYWPGRADGAPTPLWLIAQSVAILGKARGIRPLGLNRSSRAFRRPGLLGGLRPEEFAARAGAASLKLDEGPTLCTGAEGVTGKGGPCGARGAANSYVKGQNCPRGGGNEAARVGSRAREIKPKHANKEAFSRHRQRGDLFADVCSVRGTRQLRTLLFDLVRRPRVAHKQSGSTTSGDRRHPEPGPMHLRGVARGRVSVREVTIKFPPPTLDSWQHKLVEDFTPRDVLNRLSHGGIQ